LRATPLLLLVVAVLVYHLLLRRLPLGQRRLMILALCTSVWPTSWPSWLQFALLQPRPQCRWRRSVLLAESPVPVRLRQERQQRAPFHLLPGLLAQPLVRPLP
jgi:hypothetical protein